MTTLADIENAIGMTLFDYQVEAARRWQAQARSHKRLCLYYKTGAGKSVTALLLLALDGVTEALVIAPPATHPAWQRWGTVLGITVEAVSHNKFRQKGFLVSRTKALVIDEFHLLGGHTGIGWKKADRLARSLQAPIILASATPNYNDAERVYCIQHVLDPESIPGGFLQFLYRHCETEENPFGQIPKVTGFLHHADAKGYLAALPQVSYVADDVDVDIEDIHLVTELPPGFDSHKLDTPRERIMASQMEERHRRRHYQRVKATGRVHKNLVLKLEELIEDSATPVLMFCMAAKTATILFTALSQRGLDVSLVTGSTPTWRKNEILEEFRKGHVPVLLGTASLATGPDGLDKVCDTMIIVDDTDDDSLRRQLVGRILPRGADTDASKKRLFRLVIEA